jgi:tetratricopeptide (TPR) repeat protein
MRRKITTQLLCGALFAVFGAARNVPGQTVSESHTRIRDPDAGAQQKLLADAQAALDQRDYATAAQKYQDYLAKKPGDAFAHFQLGYAYTAMQRLGDAKTEYEKAIDLDPEMGPAYTNLGMTLLAMGDPGAAVEPLEKAAELAPADAHPSFLVGVALERSGKVAEAIGQYQAAEKLDDRNIDVRAALGRALLASNRAADAEAEFRAAVALQPYSPQAHLGLAQSLMAEKKMDEAAAELDSYLKSRPNDAEARIERASILIGAGRYEDGIAELDQAAGALAPKGTPEDMRVLRLRAQAYLGEKKYDLVIPVLEKAAALAPQDPQFPAALGHAYLEKKDYANAIRMLVAAFKMDSSLNDVLVDLVAAEYGSKNFAAALQGIDLLSERKELPLGSWFVRASCYDKLGDAAHALDAYRKFLQLNKDENSDMYFVASARVRALERELQQKKR